MGERKIEIAQQMAHNSALATRAKIINDLIPDNTNLNSQHNPLMVTLNSLRLLKSKSRPHNSADPIDVLL